MSGRPLLVADGLKKSYASHGSRLLGRRGETVHAVSDVSISVPAGGTLGIVGESGCGKSTLARLITRLLEPTSGRLWFDGADVTMSTGAALRAFRADVQMVFQDPMGSLNPRQTVADILATPRRFLPVPDDAPGDAELLAQVGLPSGALTRHPHEFSGGQRQRIGIARALIAHPRLIVADEPVSALDVSIQAQILNLFLELQADLGLSYVFISHDLAVVRRMADEIAVMYLGRVVEHGPADEVLERPLHPYTIALAGSVLTADPSRPRQRIVAPGDVSTDDTGLGCAFAARCPLVEGRCRTQSPALRPTATNREVACHVV